MLSICDCYADEFSVTFNDKKSKRISFVPCGKSAIANKAELCIGGKPIDYITSWSRLGNILNDGQDDSSSILLRRGKMPGQTKSRSSRLKSPVTLR